MLIITRRPGESLRIGDTITVTITKISRGQVGIAIAAPPEVRILREELVGAGPNKTWRKP